ncbi:MAG TPA: hypothetical protein PKJ95_01085, partial [Atribacterota bacterium]|nr:hypothetical protein [Atribacterota bacterium]
HFALATRYSKENRYQDALANYKIVLKNQPNYPELKINYYLTYIKYFVNSIFLKIVIALIVLAIVLFFVILKFSNKKKKSGKHYRSSSSNRF